MIVSGPAMCTSDAARAAATIIQHRRTRFRQHAHSHVFGDDLRLLPVFLVRVLGASMASVGLIEGLAEATNSLIKIFSGAASDWIGRRKPIVVFGYTLSAVIKTTISAGRGCLYRAGRPRH